MDMDAESDADLDAPRLTVLLNAARERYTPWLTLYEEVYGPITTVGGLAVALGSLGYWFLEAARGRE